MEGRLTEVTYPASSEIGTISYSYNTYGDLAEIKVNGDVIRTYTYDNFARVASIKDYDEPGSSSYILKSYQYDELGRAVAMVYTEDGNAENILESYAYSYDKNDMIVSETRISNLPETAINETRAYEYDAYGRLIKTTITDHAASDTLSVTTYEYDAVGNRIRMTVDGVSTDYDYNGLGQLTKMDMPDDEIVYTYDGRGNQIKEENTTDNEVIETVFNVSGQMVSLTKKTNDTVIFTQNNVYDHEGTRISKTENNVSREYYYCNGGVAYTEDNNTLSVSNIQNVDGSTFATVRDEVYYNYLKNIQGSTSGIVSETGATSAVYEYTDFGETEERTGGNFDNEICYTGAIYDKSTGLYYLNARYYDPANARFISQDTYRGEVDDAGTWHLYAYCANNPINYVDPTGHALIAIAAVTVSAKTLVTYIGGTLLLCYMSTPLFRKQWTYFCNVTANGLASLWNIFVNNRSKIYSWSKAKVKKVSKEVSAFSEVVRADEKIRTESKKKKYKYFQAWKASAGGYGYVAIGKGMDFSSAKSRVKAEKDVMAVTGSHAKTLASNIGGVVGPENHCVGKLGYYWHYHVKYRALKSHLWYYV